MRCLVAAGALALAGCGDVPPSRPPASLAIPLADAGTVVEALVGKPSANWQDAALAPAGVRARRPAYRLAGAAIADAVWQTGLGTTATNVPAYRHANLQYGGPEPKPADSLYVVTEAPAGTPQVFRIAASDGRLLNGTGWDALAALKAPGTVQRSAVVLSGDARRLYLLTSGGWFITLDAETGARLFQQKLSASGFAGLAPFIDYSNGGGYPRIGSDENVWAVSADGSLYRVNVKDGAHSVAAWPAAGGSDATAWSGRATIDYGEPTSVRAYPLVWRSQAFLGTADGRCVRVDLSSGTPVVTTWRPHLSSSAASRAIDAPPAIAFDADFAVRDVFVPCGDRLAWIDAAAPATAESVRVSPPLVVTRATPVHGSLASYRYDTPRTLGPYDCIDFASIATFASPAPTRWGNGSGLDGRLFGADGYGSPNDGNRSLAYMQFEIPLDAYGGAVPTGGRLELSAASTPATAEDLVLYRASNFMADGASYWTGMNFSPDIDWFNRPALTSGAIGGFKGSVGASDGSSGLPRYALRFGDAEPVDQPNLDAYSWHTFAMVSRGKQRLGSPSAPATTEAARWHRGVVGVNATEPRLYVTVDEAALTPTTHGLRCQPAVDELARRVWVLGSNALFELSFADPQTFASRAGVTYSLTAAGRQLEGAGGPTTGTSPARFVFPRGNVLFTGERLVVADHDPAGGRFFVNQYTVPLAGSSDALAAHYAAPAGAAEATAPLMFDYAFGSTYVLGRDKRLYRVDIR